MNTAIILILGIPLIEIYLFIKVGSQIGALNTILLILTTAVVGIWYARYEGFNTLRSGMSQLVKNEVPLYEIVSGAAIAFAALLLILPGFATDIIGILLVFPVTRKIILSRYSKKYSNKNKNNRQETIVSNEILKLINETIGEKLFPGSLGENILVEGLGYLEDIENGSKIKFGNNVILEITDQNQPCSTLNSIDKRILKLIIGKRGLLAKVINTGMIKKGDKVQIYNCLLYTSPSPRDATLSRMPSSA